VAPHISLGRIINRVKDWLHERHLNLSDVHATGPKAWQLG